MNKYELTVVLDGKAGAAKKKKIIELIGKASESKDWGVRDLAYKIGKSATGLYLFFELELDGKSVKQLNDKLRVDTEILRFLIIKNG